MVTEFTVRTTDSRGKHSFCAYRSKEAAIERYTSAHEFHSRKNDGIQVELFKVTRYGSSVHSVEKIR